MKVLQINVTGNKSTGLIAVDLWRSFRERGHEGVVAYGRYGIPSDVQSIRIGNQASVYLDSILTRLTDRAGFYSHHATRKLIDQIRAFDPDVIHLHNLHGYYLHVGLLFDYLRKSGKPVVWTLHDCWAFTGHCCYYTMAGCEKWKTGCSHCPQRSAYPKSLFFDRSQWNYQRKKELFTSLPNLRLVCVSRWLEGEVSQSFLKDIPHEVIYNGVDLDVFHPRESNFRARHGLEGKIMVLGVASEWDARKGLKDFIALAGLLDERYAIVLVGLTDQEKEGLPSNILGLGRTRSAQELAEIYSAADVFFNASAEETFGLTTVEAMACGTPVVVYRSTASPELVNDEVGLAVSPGNVECAAQAIQRLIASGEDRTEKCLAHSRRFDRRLLYDRYDACYRRALSQGKAHPEK